MLKYFLDMHDKLNDSNFDVGFQVIGGTFLKLS